MGTYSYFKDYSVPRLIFEISDMQTVDANRLLKQFNITLEQTFILYHLSLDKNLSQKELSERTLKDQANTTRILKRLFDKKLISIVNSEKDKRVNIVSITSLGLEVLNDVIRCLEKSEEELNNLFPRDKSDVLKQMLIDYIMIYKDCQAFDGDK